MILHKSAHFAYWGFVWALLSSSRYMQFNIAGLEQNSMKRIKGQRALTWHSSRCQARYDRRPHRHLLCEDRRTGRFGTWSGVFFLTPWNFLWMKHDDKFVQRICSKVEILFLLATCPRARDEKLFCWQPVQEKKYLYFSTTCSRDEWQQVGQLSIWVLRRLACLSPRPLPSLPRSPELRINLELWASLEVQLTTRGCSTTTIQWSVMAKECM